MVAVRLSWFGLDLGDIGQRLAQQIAARHAAFESEQGNAGKLRLGGCGRLSLGDRATASYDQRKQPPGARAGQKSAAGATRRAALLAATLPVALRRQAAAGGAAATGSPVARSYGRQRAVQPAHDQPVGCRGSRPGRRPNRIAARARSARTSLSASHTLTARSSPAETSVRPSGEKTSLMIAPSWANRE